MDNYIRKFVGENYDDFWDFKGRYRVIKGSRASKKSTTAALYYIYEMMKYFYKYGIVVNLLVIRRYFRTLQESVYNQLKDAIQTLGVQSLWKFSKSPLKITFMPSGGEIIFRGLDDSLKLTSIKPSKGYLPWVFIEEAYELENEDEFNKLEMSIRGKLPGDLFAQFTFVFNPWSVCWLKTRFFDKVSPETGISKDGQIMALTKNYDCNEFLDEQFLQVFKRMKIENPKRYAIEGLGQWGRSTGLIYDNWEILDFDWEKIHNYRIDGFQSYKKKFGLDFGFSIDPTGFVALLANEDTKEIYIYDEFGSRGMTNEEIADEIKQRVSKNSLIIADCADPRTINELWMKGINIVGSKKGKDSIIAGIQKLQEYKIYVHPRCVNIINELRNYSWDVDKNGEPLNKPVDKYNHWLDALRYSCEDIVRKEVYF